MERPPDYQESQPRLDYYEPRVRDFQPEVPPRVVARDIDTDTESLLPSYAAAAAAAASGKRRYRGLYSSEEEYLEALKAFIEEKKYSDGLVDGSGNPVGIVGFYGTKTGSDYANQPGPRTRRTQSAKKSIGEDVTANTTEAAVSKDPKTKTGLWKRLRKDRSGSETT